MSTFQQFNLQPSMTPVRLVANSNQSGTYFNGPINNGVGATFTYATGALTIDSVAVNVGDRILLAGQSSAFQNGIYVCTQAGATGVAAVLQRAADMQCIEQIHTGFYVSVQGGTVFGGSLWAVVEPKPAQLGVSSLLFNNSALEAGGNFLLAANNLSDVASAATSRTNLGLGTTNTPSFAGVTITKANGTEASNAVTANGSAGVITTSSLTTAGGSSYAITWTNSAIAAGSVVLLSLMGGSNTTENITMKATAGSGSSTLTIYNNTAATALNGTILIGYQVI